MPASENEPEAGGGKGPGLFPRDWTVTFHVAGILVVMLCYGAYALLAVEGTARQRVNYTIHLGIYSGVLVALAVLARFRPLAAAIIALPVVVLWSLSAAGISRGGMVVAIACIILAARALQLALRSLRRVTSR